MDELAHPHMGSRDVDDHLFQHNKIFVDQVKYAIPPEELFQGRPLRAERQPLLLPKGTHFGREIGDHHLSRLI